MEEEQPIDYYLTAHAWERLAERWPSVHLVTGIEAEISAKIGSATHVIDGLKACQLAVPVDLDAGPRIYPVVADDGGILTVMAPGMVFQASTGPVVLDSIVQFPGTCQMSAAAYHADRCPAPSLSSGSARTLLFKSPAHAAHQRLHPPQSAAFDIGRAAHRRVLGAGDDYAVIPSDLLSSNGAISTKAAKEWKEAQEARGLTVVKQDDADRVDAMASAVTAHLRACGITLDPAASEICAFAEIDGVWCRAMIDNAPNDPRLPLYDLKTTTDASPESIARTVAKYGYDVQAEHYRQVWKAATGEDRAFRFIFVEKDAPHGCCVAELFSDPEDPADWSLDAAHKCQEARRIWAECIAANNWPGYPAGIAVIGNPAWHSASWADRALPPSPSQEALRAAHDMQSPMEAIHA